MADDERQSTQSSRSNSVLRTRISSSLMPRMPAVFQKTSPATTGGFFRRALSVTPSRDHSPARNYAKGSFTSRSKSATRDQSPRERSIDGNGSTFKSSGSKPRAGTPEAAALTYVMRGYLNKLDELLESGEISANYQDQHQRSLMTYAAMEGQVQIADYLFRTRQADLHSCDVKGRNALIWMATATRPNLRIARILIEGGIDLNHVDNERNSALHVACNAIDSTEKVLFIRHLLKCPDIMLHLKNSQGKTAYELLRRVDSSWVKGLVKVWESRLKETPTNQEEEVEAKKQQQDSLISASGKGPKTLVPIVEHEGIKQEGGFLSMFMCCRPMLVDQGGK